MASGHSCSRPVPRSSLREMGVPGVRVLMLEAGAGCRTTRDGGAHVRVLTHETGAGAARARQATPCEVTASRWRRCNVAR